MAAQTMQHEQKLHPGGLESQGMNLHAAFDFGQKGSDELAARCVWRSIARRLGSLATQHQSKPYSQFSCTILPL